MEWWRETEETDTGEEGRGGDRDSSASTEKHYQHCAYEVGKPYGYPDGAVSLSAPFQPHVLEKADKCGCNWNTESGGNSSHSDPLHLYFTPASSVLPHLPLRHTAISLLPSLLHALDFEGKRALWTKEINGVRKVPVAKASGQSHEQYSEKQEELLLLSFWLG
ncbi:unnamed protein product [Pleuronectes platessa]|uniref:Uncharacterized protein n=1 Tax=Pleuronectes platessa TaxID=8262 RepID=A0A9N7UBP7_PLEPL|nr:unnamed protein product [Pleuronectes platessa]